MNKITFLLCIVICCCFYTVSANNIVAPVNDNCANATTLTVNPAQDCIVTSTATFSAATVSPEGNTCTAATTGDIWYQFVATSDSHSIALSSFTGTAQPVAMVLYEGADCTTFTQVYCSINNVINATALDIGETYKLRLYFNTTNPSLGSTTFKVCVTTPPPPSDSNQSDCVITTINYDFESPQPPPVTNFPIFVNHNVVQGWRTTASDQMMEFWPVPNYENVPAYSGIQFIELNANLVSGVYQDYQTPETTTFSYGFAHRGRQGTDTCQLLAGPPGGPYTPVGSPVTTGNTAWSYNTGTYDVPSGQTVTRFIFQSVSSVGGASVGNYLDAITFTANNGILSPNPYNMDCGDLIASVEAAGTGTWVPHSDNPSATTIADASSNDTTISDFATEGLYHYDWVTQYCVTTLEISFSGDSVPPPVVSDVVYCQDEAAVPLTAEALPGNDISWFAGAAPVPDTSILGSTNYYVSQVAPSGCESVAALIVVTVTPVGNPVTDFTLPTLVCSGSAMVQPQPATDFTAGGTYSAESGLAIDGITGEIDPGNSTPGDYNVTYAIDANACTAAGSSTVPITIAPVPDAPDITLTQPDCFTATGVITINSPIGNEYTYSIDGTNYQSAAVFNTVAPGTYTVYVQNNSGCITEYNPVTIDPALVTPATPDAAIVQPTCAVSTATITVNSPTGADLTYSINSTDYQAATEFTDVAPGNYTLSVVNGDGCMATIAIVIDQQPPTPAVPNVTASQPNCNTSSGKLTVNSPLGAGLTYSIDGTNYQAGSIFSGLAQGNYTVTVKNTFGCTAESASFTINEPPLPVPSPQLSASHPDCFTGVGTISVNSPLGAGYTYSVDGINFQAGTLFTNMVPGDYTVLVKSADGCTAGGSINIAPSPGTPAVADLTVSQPDCGAMTGTITVNSPVGPALTYSINGVNFQQSTVFTGLAPGSYTITVRNSAGCISVTNPVTINPSPAVPVIPVITAVQATCYTPTGTITIISPIGADLIYSIDGINYQPETEFTDLTAGVTYNVTVMNAAGCTAMSLPLTIHDAPYVPPVPTVTVQQPDCSNPRGVVTVDAPNGAGIRYSINGISFQPNPVFTNIQPGTYTITVRSTAGCTASHTITVDSAPIASDPGVITGPVQVCEEEMITLENAIPDGTWSVSNEDRATINELGELTGISSGNVIVYYTVQNPDECEAVAQFSVWVIGAPRPELNDTAICKDLETGEYATAFLDTGLSETEYSFIWFKGTTELTETSSSLIVSEPGEYSVDVTRLSSGCTGTGTATVTVSSQAVVEVVVGEDFDYQQSITVNVIEGSGDYEFQLNNGPFQDQPVFTGIRQGEYTVTVRDKNGCGSETITVYALNYPRFFSPNGDGVHDTWFIDGLTDNATTSIYIYDRYGKVVGSVIPGSSGWDGTFAGEILPATDYWFRLFYSSPDGVSKEFKAHFSLIR